jgi:protein-tyrosine phosphatase
VPRPRGAEWLGDEIRAWREAGIDLVVSLLEADEEVALDLAGEAAASRAQGLAFRAFPIPDRGVPKSHEAVAALTEQLMDALRSDKTVAVHCRQGVGRSALIVAAALIAGGLDAQMAVDTVRRSRGLDVPETAAQRQWISDFAAWWSRAVAAPHQRVSTGAPHRS